MKHLHATPSAGLLVCWALIWAAATDIAAATRQRRHIKAPPSAKAAPSHQAAQYVRNLTFLSIASKGQRRVELATTARAKDPCVCVLSEEGCSCTEAMRLMDCIVDACTHGECKCEQTIMKDVCLEVASTCPMLSMKCTEERAECWVDEHSRVMPAPAGNATQDSARPAIKSDPKYRPPRQIEEKYEALRSLKEERCRLKVAAMDGWLNAEKNLADAEAKIKAHMQDLAAAGRPLPQMKCDKPFEDFQDPSPAATTPEPAAVKGNATESAPMVVPMPLEWATPPGESSKGGKSEGSEKGTKSEPPLRKGRAKSMFHVGLAFVIALLCIAALLLLYRMAMVLR